MLSGLRSRHDARDLLEPAGRAGRHDAVRQGAARAGHLVDHVAGAGDLVVGEEQVLVVVGGRAGDHRDLGVAVDEDLLHVVLELVAREALAAGDVRVPVLLREVGGEHQQLLAVVVAHEMRLAVDDELLLECRGACVGHAGRGGLGTAGGEHRAKDLVHGEKGGRHAGGRRQESAAAQAVLRCELVARSPMRASTRR